MRIFITGTSGFIGFHLAKKLLDNGHIVFGFDVMNDYYDVNLKKNRNKILLKYKKYYFLKGNIENYNKLKTVITKFKPEIIIHLAAQAGVRYSLKNPDKYLKSNLKGTFNILEVSRIIKIKHLIIGSSSSVYGANKKFPFKEIHKTDNQISFYAATKKSTESMAHSYSSLWKIPITSLRFFTVYGPWGRPDMAYFKFTQKIINNKIIEIYNKGKMFRDYTYIDDIINGIYLLLKKSPNLNQLGKYRNDSLSNVAPFRILNIGNTKKVLLSNFIKSIENELQLKAKKKYLPLQKGDVISTLSDTSLLQKITGYKTKVNYKEGIAKFISWYKSYYK